MDPPEKEWKPQNAAVVEASTIGRLCDNSDARSDVTRVTLATEADFTKPVGSKTEQQFDAENNNGRSDQDVRRQHSLAQTKLASAISIAMAVLFGSLGIAFGVVYEGTLLIILGSESLVNAFSSILVLWRFKTRISDSTDSETVAELKSVQRESWSCALVGVLFALLGTYVLIETFLLSSQVIRNEQSVSVSRITAWLAWPNVLISLSLALWKLELGRKLDSWIVREDAFCSAFGGALALVFAASSSFRIHSFGESALVTYSWSDILQTALLAILLLAESAFIFTKLRKIRVPLSPI